MYGRSHDRGGGVGEGKGGQNLMEKEDRQRGIGKRGGKGRSSGEILEESAKRNDLVVWPLYCKHTPKGLNDTSSLHSPKMCIHCKYTLTQHKISSIFDALMEHI